MLDISNIVCYGCSACMNKCPLKCISMEINDFGELRPVINKNICIDCKKCEDVCPSLHKPIFSFPMSAYALTIKDMKKKKDCASGGAARIFYLEALQRDYIVFGCDFDANMILHMHSASFKEDIDGFMNSKYTYCRMDNTFNEIAKLLLHNKKVLFIGTSCQVDALNVFLGKRNTSNLITIDLICHGVPPEKYFLDYLKIQQDKISSKIDNVLFRGRTKKNDFFIQIFSNEKLVYKKYAREDLFFSGYVNCAIFEEKCYTCRYASKNRISDITIGDYYGRRSIEGEKISAVLINTQKGNDFFKCINNNDILLEKVDLNEIFNSNEQLKGPSSKPEYYKEMRECYRVEGYKEMVKLYILPLIKQYYFRKRISKFKSLINMPIKILKKIIRVVFN